MKLLLVTKNISRKRSALTVLLLVVASTHLGCSSPQCSEDEVRIGTRCVSTGRADGGTDSTAEMDSTSDGEDPRNEQDPLRDGGRNRDSSQPAADAVNPNPNTPAGLDSDAATPSADAANACRPTPELCNGIDDDCDGIVDEDASDPLLGMSCDNGGKGTCAKPGRQVCFKGMIVCDAPPPMPQIEVCDGIDNDCVGGADNGLTNACRGSDCSADMALLGQPCVSGQNDCQGRGVWQCDPTANNNALRCSAKELPKNACGTSCGPVPAETCNGIDEDCDGSIDEGLKNACGGSACGADLGKKGASCTTTEGECTGTGTWECDATAGNNQLYCKVTRRTPSNLVSDSGFEQQPQYSISPPWSNFKGAFISNDPHRGSHSATVVCDKQNSTTNASWNDVYQTIEVKPNTRYKLEAWVKTSANLTYGRLGARSNPDWMNELAENWGYVFAGLPEYTYVSTRFTTGPTTTKADVYVGGQGSTGSTSVIVDDVSVTPEMACQ